MRTMKGASWLLLLPLWGGGCQYLEEVRDLPETVGWGGSVLAAFSGEETSGGLTEGTVTLVDLADTVLEEATQPFPDSLDYWRFSAVPAGEAVAIRVASPALDLTPMVWRAEAPRGEAIWLTGALFGREASIYEEFFAGLEGYEGVTLEPLSGGSVAYLWGEPLEPERWSGAEVVVTDGQGASAVVWRFAYGATGGLVAAGAGPVDLFIAPNLAPGTVTLQVDGGTETQWPARGGDVLSAIFYDLGEE